jgi:hypothetical protein
LGVNVSPIEAKVSLQDETDRGWDEVVGFLLVVVLILIALLYKKN